MAIQNIQLTLLIGPTVPIPAPRPVMQALQSVEVTTTVGSPSGFQLSFGCRIGRRFTRCFSRGQRRTARAPGHSCRHDQWNAYRLVRRNHHAAGDRAGAGRILDADDHRRRSYLCDGSPAVQRHSVSGNARRGARRAHPGEVCGVRDDPLVIPSIFQDIPIPTERIPSHEGTDLAYINRLAADVGHTFYIDPGPLPGMNTAYWGPQIKIGVPQPALNTDMDAHTNVESLTFNVRHNESALPIVFIQEPISKASIPIPIPAINPLQPPLGIALPIPTRIDLMKDTAKLNPIAAIAKGVAAAAGSADFVEGSGSLNVLRYGRLLKARQLVGVRGAGLAFDGLYYVKSVTSTLKQGEFKQRFSLTRNALVSITPVVPA